MLYMALSLGLHRRRDHPPLLLWGASPVEGQTLMRSRSGDHRELRVETGVTHGALVVVLALEAGLLFVAANTGFLGGPRGARNMARRFLGAAPVPLSLVSARDRKRDSRHGRGITRHPAVDGGSVATLVVPLQRQRFSSLQRCPCSALCLYWAGSGRRAGSNWLRAPGAFRRGVVVCVTILSVLLADKFMTEAGSPS